MYLDLSVTGNEIGLSIHKLYYCVVILICILHQLSNTQIHTGIKMKSTVLEFLLLLYSSCWMAVAEQTCQLKCKFGHHWHYSAM